MTATLTPDAAQASPIPSLLIRSPRAAKLLAISERKLWSLTASGEVPSIRIGRSVRYSPKTLEAFVATNEQGGQR